MATAQHLQTLAAVCRHTSFAVAARELGYTASAVSQQMSALERTTGLRLFERGAQGVRPTTAAHDLLVAGGRVLAALDDFDRHVRDLAAGETGHVRIGSFPTASVRLLPRALSRFARRHPRAEVQLTECEPDEAADLLSAGRLDLAVVYAYGLDPRRWPDGSTLDPLLTEPLLLLRAAPREAVSPAADPDRTVPPLDPAELAGRRWITSAAGSAGARSFERWCAIAGFVPQVVFRTNNYDVVRELVAAGFGLAVIPMLGHRQDRRIDATPVPGEGAFRTVSVLHRGTVGNPLLLDARAALRQSAARLGSGTEPSGT